ncbi:ATP phosphoribosyltransferase [archaeon]|nr:ATP phosphoribosyltransferase [archaeon]
MIKLAVPNKGRLHEPAMQLLAQAGFKPINTGERKLFASTLDPEIMVLFLRARDIPEFVNTGAADLGVTGYDIIMENNYDVEVLIDLNFGKAKLAVAAPHGKYRSIKDIGEGARVATKFSNLTEKFFASIGKKIEILKVSGATEIAPQIGVAEFIVDLVGTGTTLRMNNLEVLDVVLETSAHLIGNRESIEKNREKIDEVVLAFESVLKAKKKKLLMMNVPRESLEELRKVMPGMAGPTISEVISDKPMVAVNVVVDEEHVYKMISRVKSIGARDVLVIDIERIIE